MPKASPQYLRVGLLLSALAMSAVLVATGIWLHAKVHNAASAVTKGQSIGIAFAARRGLRSAAKIDNNVLHDVLDELAPQGLRYVEVRSTELGIIAVAGQEATSIHWSPENPMGRGATIAFDRDGAMGRITVRPMEMVDPGGMQHRDGPPPGPPPDQAFRNRQVIFEVDSTAAHALVWQASLMLVVGYLAATVMLGLAAVFWRISKRVETVSAQLEHDRQLKILGQMSAVLGHEVRNPLASLKGHAQLLLEKLPPDHSGHKGAETVLRETIRLEDLSRQVLEFARTGSVEIKPTSPAAVVRAAVEDLGTAEIRLDVTGAPASWVMDSARMEEVLVNLLRNARDASKAGQPIEVTVCQTPDRSLRFEVRDHGEGIAEAEEERLFEPFYTKRAKGTGLGLALARRIVEGHGGTISARNHPGGGAVFTVCLPPQAQGA